MAIHSENLIALYVVLLLAIKQLLDEVEHDIMN